MPQDGFRNQNRQNLDIHTYISDNNLMNVIWIYLFIYFLIFRLLLCYFLYPESSPRSPKCNAQHQNFAWGKFWPYWAQFLNVIAQKQSAQLLLYYYLYNTLAQKHATTTKSLFGWLCLTFYAKVHFKLDFLENSVKIHFHSMFFLNSLSWWNI